MWLYVSYCGLIISIERMSECVRDGMAGCGQRFAVHMYVDMYVGVNGWGWMDVIIPGRVV